MKNWSEKTIRGKVLDKGSLLYRVNSRVRNFFDDELPPGGDNPIDRTVSPAHQLHESNGADDSFGRC